MSINRRDMSRLAVGAAGIALGAPAYAAADTQNVSPTAAPQRETAAAHIDGPLYYEKMGRKGPVIAFVHPNPMDQSCWIFQMAQLSTWYRCISIDIPGYGRSPKAQDGLTMDDMAQGCWDAIDSAYPGEKAILTGCSTGSTIVPHMRRLKPDRAAALVLSGTGYNPNKNFIKPRVQAYKDRGVEYRWEYAFDDMSPAFRATNLASFFADMFAERDEYADVDSIIRQFTALAAPDPEDLYSSINCPTIILSGEEDATHPTAFALQPRIPNCEL